MIPALSHVINAGQCGDLSIVGVTRQPAKEFEIVSDSTGKTCSTTSLFHMDTENIDDYKRLREHLDDGSDQTLFYLSVPPSAVTDIIKNLGEAGLNTSGHKLLLEKPFGSDYASAQDVIGQISEYFHEDQIFRIDHYLAKEMAQNIITFRARNAIFANIWNNRHIERIEVVALESIDIEGRANFYEQTGALRDVLQGHLMQLLALTLAPLEGGVVDWDQLPTRRLEALNSLDLANPERSYRSQYEGYRDEVDNPDSVTETFVSIELKSQLPEWEGVPFALTTGKALSTKKTEVRVHFRRTDETQSNYLRFKIQPNEGIAIDLVTKKPGYEQDVEKQQLSYYYPQDERLPDAYEQVLIDAINSRKSLFTCSDEVLRAWEIVRPIQESWVNNEQIDTYPKGSEARNVISDLN